MELTTLEPGTLLLDASTVEFLDGHVIYHALTGPYWADEHMAEILRTILVRQADQNKVEESDASDLYALTQALSFLEQWMLAEELLVDRSALNSLANHNRSEMRTEHLGKLGALYTVTDIPQNISKKAANHVVAFVDLMRDLNNPLHMADLDLPLKDSHYNNINANLGVSGNVPARALFYLELSRLLNGPLLLHPEKSIYLGRISQAIVDGFASVYKSLVKGVRDGLQLKELAIPIPPIADEILRTACSEKCSLLEAAKAIHESNEMVSLRAIVWELTTLASGGQRIRYEREIALRTKEIADSIQSRAVAGTRISRRTVNLAEMPAIGAVFKVLGGGSMTVPDFVLYERPHIALFSRWANEARPRASGC